MRFKIKDLLNSNPEKQNGAPMLKSQTKLFVFISRISEWKRNPLPLLPFSNIIIKLIKTEIKFVTYLPWLKVGLNWKYRVRSDEMVW